MTDRYRLVDPAERVVRIACAVAAIPVIVALYTAGAFLSAPMTVGLELVVVAAVGLSAGGLSILWTGTRDSRRELAAVEVGPEGVHVRASRHGSRSRVHVPWAEIGSIAVAPTDPGPDPAPDARAVGQWLALADAMGEDLHGRQRWRPAAGCVRVVIGLLPRAPAQATDFARRMISLHGLADRFGDRSDEFRSLVDALLRWQERWSSEPRTVGLHVEVREAVLDRARLYAAVETNRPGLPVRTLPPLSWSVLDTPHDIAALLHHAAVALPRSDR